MRILRKVIQYGDLMLPLIAFVWIVFTAFSQVNANRLPYSVGQTPRHGVALCLRRGQR
jgi:hypothetical protein